MASELWAAYEADCLLVRSDPTLTNVEKARIMTELYHKLLAAEEAAGIQWKELFTVSVEAATENGSSRIIDLRKDANQ